MNGWRYYKHAMLPTVAPHEEVNTQPIEDGSIWRSENKPLFARWTTNFDCHYETPWWYCIKDTPFEFEQVKSKHRTEIRKSIKNCDVRYIDAKEYAIELSNVTLMAFNEYPIQYRPKETFESLLNNFANCNQDESNEYWGVFSRESGKLIGYAMYIVSEKYVNQCVVKMDPRSMSLGGNTALVYTTMNEYIAIRKKYICNGERNLVHKTNYEEFLIRHFDYRRVYCHLHMEYRPRGVKVAFRLLYPIRKLLKLFIKNNLVYKVIAILMMEEIKRKCEKEYV